MTQTLEGFLGRDRKILETRGGREYAVLTLATHRDRQTTWHRLIVWNLDQPRHFGVRICRRGDRVEVQGHEEAFTYTKDGEDRTVTSFVVDRLRIVRKHRAPEVA